MAEHFLLPLEKINTHRLVVGGLVAGVLLCAPFLIDAVFWGNVLPVAGGAVALLTMLLAFAQMAGQWRQNGSLKSVRNLDENAPTSVLVADREGALLYANASARNTLAFKGDSVTIASVLGQVLADPSLVQMRILAQLNAKPWALERLQTRQGELRISARRMSAGLVYYRFEKGFSEGSKQLHEFPTLTIGRNGVVLFMSAAVRGIFGGRIRSVQDVVIGKFPENGGPVQLRTKDGPRNYHCLIGPERGGRQEVIFIESSAPMEVNLQIFDHLPISLLQLNKAGEIVGANDAAVKLLESKNVKGKNLADFFDELGRPFAAWQSDVSTRQGSNKTEFLRLSSSRVERFVQINLSAFRSNGEDGFLAVLSDATELKSMEAQFVQSQKMQAIGQLAGGIAHDFNNLLTAMSGHCDLLLLRHGENDPEYADLDQIRQNANRAAALVGQLLAFSRKQSLQPELLDLEATLYDHTHLLNRLVGENTRLELRHAPHMRPIRADKRQFEQVIMNLVVNARDAMGGAGVIQIETETLKLTDTLERDRVRIPPGEYCSITVEDDGCGIPEDKQKRIFEPFYTSKKTGEGTGLGLSTVYGIVKQSGGFIFVDSVVGQGTRFQLLFPTEAPANQRAVVEEKSVSEAESRSDGVILLVEDEDAVRAFASRALRLKGFTVIEASCAEEALAKLNDGDMQVDVFVTDVVMPGIDGPTWVAQALKARPDTKVVFVSGYSEEKLDELRRNIPNSVFLPKPFSLTQLTSTVAQVH